MSKYQALEEALKAVTSTNWEHDGGADVFEVDVGVLVASTMETEDAAYIAEANPATIRALLADLERAEKALRAITHHQANPVPAPVDELIEALEDLMDWQVKNVKSWHNRAYDRAHFVIEKHRAARQSPAPQTKGGEA